jgi:spermidine synthase
MRQAVDGGLAELIADPDQPGAWTLLVDGTPQSHVDLGDPRHLEFEYMRRIGHLLDLAAPAGQPLRVLHLGAGALTLARYVAATRPGSRQLAVEIDAALVEFVRRWLPFAQRGRGAAGRDAGRPRIRAGDARAALEGVPAGSYDVVIADVFAGARTPAHLTSAEFAAAAAAALGPGGLYVTNVGDGPPLAHARAQVATVRTAFRDACLIADAAVLRGRRFGNLVVAGAQEDLPAGELTRRAAADPFPGRLLHGSGLTGFTAGAKPVTDATAAPSAAPPAGVFAARRAVSRADRR